MASFYDFELLSIDGKKLVFDQFKGKKVLLVNVASACGYTPQYEHLQAFHEKYSDHITVVGVPANNFGAQEPGSDQQIQQFCQTNYGVTFPMLSKIEVVGAQQHPLYQWLEAEVNKAPTWNFCKYLVDEEGNVMDFFSSGVSPFDEPILKSID